MSDIRKHFLVGFLTWMTSTLATAGPALASQQEYLSGLKVGEANGANERGAPLRMSLHQAISLGLQENRAIRGAYVERIAQKFDLRVEEDRFTPKVVLSGRVLREEAGGGVARSTTLTPLVSAITPFGTRLSLGWTKQLNQSNNDPLLAQTDTAFSLIQPLLRDAGWEVNMAPLRLARLNEQLYRLDIKSRVAQVITQVIRAYRELMRTQEQAAIADAALERSRRLIEINRSLIRAGRMAEFDIVQTEASAADQELNAEEARNQLAASQLDLLRLLSLDLTRPIEASDDLKAEQIVVNIDQALMVAWENQPDYLAQLIAIKQNEIRLIVASNQKLWDVSLLAGARRGKDSLSQPSRRSDNYFGFQVDIPFGDLTRSQPEVRARSDVTVQTLQLAERRQLVEQNVSNAVRGLSTRWRQYVLAQKARDLSLKKLDIERTKLTLGRSSNFQVLSFESDLRNAEQARLNALLAYLNTQAELDLQLGTTLDSWKIRIDE